MIIFDLDGTLADCEHRRHLVDFNKAFDTGQYLVDGYEENCPVYLRHKLTKEKWKPDYQAFYEACDNDDVIVESFQILQSLKKNGFELQIWSGRCESVRTITEKWFKYACIHLDIHRDYIQNISIKMRPIGDNTPDEQLKERWLMERYNHISLNTETGKVNRIGHDIDFVFDDRPKVIKMWRRRGIFVFNCCQHEGEF